VEARDTARVLVLQVICGGIAASVPVYVALAWFLLGAGKAPAFAVRPPLPTVLAAAAVLLLVAARPLERAVLAAGGQGGPTAPDRFAIVQRAHLVGFALREAAAIVGFVLTVATADIRWVLAAGALALVAMAAAWPTAARVERLLAPPDAAIEP